MSLFTKDLPVKGISIPQDIETLFEALDTNKDNLLSINEFCICLEGVQQSIEQRLRQFDPELEKSLVNEINMLFDFFDSNKDGTVTIEELMQSMKAHNPYMTLAEVQMMMK